MRSGPQNVVDCLRFSTGQKSQRKHVVLPRPLPQSCHAAPALNAVNDDDDVADLLKALSYGDRKKPVSR
jgi:hypothetical protein